MGGSLKLGSSHSWNFTCNRRHRHRRHRRHRQTAYNKAFLQKRLKKLPKKKGESFEDRKTLIDTHDRQSHVTKMSYSEWLIWGCDIKHVMGRLRTFRCCCFGCCYAKSFVHLQVNIKRKIIK